MAVQTKISPSLEDYLEMIFFLKQKLEVVRVTDVANELNISKPSVNKAVKTLKENGFVLHEHYGNLDLTEQGLDLARGVAKRHTVIKRFLWQLLGVPEDVAEEEACKMEHSMSLDTVERLAQYLEDKLSTEWE